jgi:hypothetical protein
MPNSPTLAERAETRQRILDLLRQHNGGPLTYAQIAVQLGMSPNKVGFSARKNESYFKLSEDGLRIHPDLMRGVA